MNTISNIGSFTQGLISTGQSSIEATSACDGQDGNDADIQQLTSLIIDNPF